METNTAGEVRLSRYKAWDLPTRLFHWINLLLVLLLVIIGGVMMFKSDFGISGLDAKIGLKTLHVWIGYAFAINLAFRLLWGLFGPIKARLGKLLPKKGNWQAIVQHSRKAKTHNISAIIRRANWRSSPYWVC